MMAMADIPSEEGLKRSDSPQDASQLSEISICKEQLGEELEYAVKKLEDKDNAGYVATWKNRLHQLLPLTSVSSIAAYWLYATFRVRCTIAAQRASHIIYPMAWIYLGVEVGVSRESAGVSQSPTVNLC